MIKQIQDGISFALKKAYPHCLVYGDARIRQGLETPSFFVGFGECSQNTLPNGLVKIRQLVEVVYFSKEEGDINDMWEVGPGVMGLLGELSLLDGSKVRGTLRRCTVQDDVMHIYAMYDLRVRPIEQYKMMEELIQKTMISW